MDKTETYRKIDIIAERLEGYKLHNPKTAIISYSGGRDSHLILHIVRNILNLDNSRYPALFANTRNEFADIRKRIEEQDIATVGSGRNLLNVFQEEGVPLYGKMFSKYWWDIHVNQWDVKIKNDTMLKDYAKRCDWVNANGLVISDRCCKFLKTDLLKNAKVVGLRKAEKGRRSIGNSKDYDFCVRQSKTLFKPIFDVSDEDLTEIEAVLGITNPPIYNYLERTGCVMCGFGTKKQLIDKVRYLSKFEPKRAEFFIKYFSVYLKHRGVI
jgi:3'-phosphoadenosine 5'-phosphosulfate sulfotransferase (PAPS reductase)/FAD synthetase